MIEMPFLGTVEMAELAKMLFWSVLFLFLWGVVFLTHAVPVPPICRPIALIAMLAICICACPLLGKVILVGFGLVTIISMLIAFITFCMFLYEKFSSKSCKGKDQYE